MRLLFIHYATIDKEGFGRTFKIAKEIHALGHSVVFITNQPNTNRKFPIRVEYRNGVKLISFPEILPSKFSKIGFGFFSAILKTLYLIKNHNFDLIHSDVGHRPSVAFPVFFGHTIFGIPHITEWWDFFSEHQKEKTFFKRITHGFYDRIFQKYIIKKADGIIVLSKFLEKCAIEWNIPNKKITIIHGGSDVNEIPFYNNNFKIKEKYNIPANSLTFGFIGMMPGEFKDIIPFIEAVNCLKNSFEINWFTTGWIIPEKLKNKYNIGQELIELGWQDYKKYTESIACADVFILLQRETPRNEARWPNKLGDYLAAGRKILTNPYGDIIPYVNKYPEAFISVKYNTTDIKQRIEELYRIKDIILSEALNIRQIAVKDFTWGKKAIEVVDFYHKLLQ
ncbi:MAG: glycosyltransferase [Bacteroidales bacterium]|nr:glycosyltransferase [Bacteroidales bacterium]